MSEQPPSVPTPAAGSSATKPAAPGAPQPHHGFTNAVVRAFLDSNLSMILIIISACVGLAALFLTPREEDPQIVVPLADVFVSFPGHSAKEVEQLVATPLEKLLYQIDGVEYVYSMARRDQAVITVRYYVGQDRERSLVKLYKKIDQNLDLVPPGVPGWVVKPVEIDDVPIVTLTLAPKDGAPDAPDSYLLRRTAEELAARLAQVPDLSRVSVIGGQSRVMHLWLDADKMQAYGVSPLQIQRALAVSNVRATAGEFTRKDQAIDVQVGQAVRSAEDLKNLVVAVYGERPVFLKDVADVRDGADEVASYVRHSWGPAAGVKQEPGAAGTIVGLEEVAPPPRMQQAGAAGAGVDAGATMRAAGVPAVTIAIAKKKGTNAVWVAQAVLQQAQELGRQVLPDNVEMVITRNAGLTSNDKVNELVEALGVAVIIVIVLLTVSLGWREAIVVAVAVPVVFGLTLFVNMLFGFSINRVTLFALILALGLLVDDPIVDVENISRHFAVRKKATRHIVLDAVAEIRPPLIAATLAVILSFIPMFFITGMMGPYMRPMALNVPVTMLMSMLVAFTITPWLSYHLLKKHAAHASPGAAAAGEAHHEVDPHDLDAVRQTFLWRLFYPLMAPLLHKRWLSWTFMGVMALATVAAMLLAAFRLVPLKMLPFDNKNELLLVIDTDAGTTLERTDAVVRDFEAYLHGVPEVVDVTSYVGLASPMDFNGLVRHYYLRQGDNVAEVRIDLAPKKTRSMQSHAIGLRLRDELTAIADRHHARLKIVETPPGPPVLATLVAEVYGAPGTPYEEILAAGDTVRQRMKQEPRVVDTDDSRVAPGQRVEFIVDKEKAALSGISTDDIAQTISAALGGAVVGTVHEERQRNALLIQMRLPRAERSDPADLARLMVANSAGTAVQLAELGRWETSTLDQTIYHKNLRPVAYVYGDTAGRAPAEAIVDIQADRRPADAATANDPALKPSTLLRPGGTASSPASPRPLAGRNFFVNGSNIPWSVPAGITVDFAGEGEWNITLDVFRDLGLAFGAALVGIYILLVWQTGSFVVPVIVMMAIPLTILGVMPGFWLLNHVTGGMAGGYPDPVFFTATGMIGMIALSGIVTRDSIILVDFIHLSLARGRSLFDAIMESRVVRLRPILLTASAAALGAVPITIDPIFSGLAWALIFGLIASTVFTLFVIPVAYWLLYAHKPGHGLPVSHMEE